MCARARCDASHRDRETKTRAHTRRPRGPGLGRGRPVRRPRARVSRVRYRAWGPARQPGRGGARLTGQTYGNMPVGVAATNRQPRGPRTGALRAGRVRPTACHTVTANRAARRTTVNDQRRCEGAVNLNRHSIHRATQSGVQYTRPRGVDDDVPGRRHESRRPLSTLQLSLDAT